MFKKTFTAYRLLMLVAFCTAGLFVNAQEVVHAGFTNFDYQGCVPVNIQFADNSTGNPTSWFWDFGDGHTSTEANPSNEYVIPGVYIVKLVVKNAVSADSISTEIDISGAKADFNYTYTDICRAPATVNFTVANPRNKIIYRWDFGDTHKSIVPAPSNTFASPGKYNVQLTTISPEGCEDSIIKVVQIGSTTVDFDAPATACVNEPVTLTETSTPEPISSAWIINNRVVQQDTDMITHQFTSAGIYTIQLADKFGSCSNSATKQIQVFNKPTANFALSGKTVSCSFPDTIRFQNNSANAATFKWYFGDGDSSEEVNPVHVYQAGRFSPTLVAYNANGCSDTLVKTDSVFLGGAVINSINLPDSGCIPHPVTFIADIAAPEAIATYSWNFGDGSTDVAAQPSHTYATQGRYDVSLTITTVSGCTSTNIIQKAVSVGNHSTPDFTADKTTVCGSDAIQFSGTASGDVSYWYWTFGNDADFSQNPKYSYSDTGGKTVKLIVSSSGCVDSVIKRNYILVNPPVSSFKMQVDCNDRSAVKFVDNSIAPQSWQWDFGDGTSSNEQEPPVHSYPVSGKYFASLTTTNGSCTDIFRDTIYILNTIPVFSFLPADRRVCRKSEIEIGVDNPSYILDYLWDLGDGNTLFSDTTIHYTYVKTGVYYPSLIARYRNGCQDTIYSPDSIIVTGPTANFITDLPTSCLHDTTVFIDKSFSDGEHDIINRVWIYGDDIFESDNTPPFNHVYNNTGPYRARLAVADNNNCADTARYDLYINPLPSVSAGQDTYICEGGSAQLQSSGARTYIWNQDPTLSCFSCDTPQASPKDSAVYVVTGTDENTCSASDTVLVNVIHPFTLTVDNTTADICSLKTVQLNATGADLYTWAPADGLTNSTISNPIASPAETTTYTVTGTDSLNCFSQTSSVVVNVHPNPDVAITNNELLVEKGSKNIITTTGSDNIVKWNWSPAEGLSCIDCPQPILDAEKNMTYTATVLSDFGCSDTAQLTVHILCDQSKIYIPTAFTPNGDGKNDRFYVMSSTDNPVKSFVIYSRSGETVFSKKGNFTNYSADGWDGNYKGVAAPVGTYIYRIEVVCNDNVVPLTGTVTLIR